MQVLRLHPDRQLRLHDEPVPEPGPGEALVRVEAVGLCGSDRHWLVDGGIGDAVLDRPMVLGHECSGTVETGRLRGRRVAVDPAIPCETCEFCRTDASNLCPTVRFAGHGPTDGALRQWLAWPETSLVPLSDGVDATLGALVEPLSIALHSFDLGRVVASATVGVVGCGPIGLLLIWLARDGASPTIVAIDPQPHRLAAATTFGAIQTIAAKGLEHDASAIDNLTAGRGLDVVFEVAGDQAAVETAIAAARPGGHVVMVGIPPDDRTSFRSSIARRKGLTLTFVRRAPPAAFERAARLVEARGAELRGLVTLQVPLAKAQRAFDSLVRRDGIKVLIRLDGS